MNETQFWPHKNGKLCVENKTSENNEQEGQGKQFCGFCDSTAGEWGLLGVTHLEMPLCAWPSLPPGLVCKCSPFTNRRGLPWWFSGWESACQCRGCKFDPWSGTISHAVEQLSWWARPQPLSLLSLQPVLCHKRSHRGEKPTRHN